MAGNVLHAQDTPAPTATLTAVEADRAALVALYNSTQGANWTKARKWLSEDPVGEWFGVSTDSSGRVTHLELEDNNLRGTIPAALGSLGELRNLNLARNDLTGSIPAVMGQLGKLRTLDLLFNDLTGTIPTALGDLSKLRHLKLTGNTLTGSIPNQLGNLNKLTNLLLASNRLSGSIPAELGSLSNLSILRLDSNRLTGSIPEALLEIGHLFFLGIANNNFSGCEPAGLRQLASHDDLRSLGLPRCSRPTSTLAATATLPSTSLQASDDPTATPIPAATNTPTPQPTNTLAPQPTNTPTPQPTNTLAPQPTNTLAPPGRPQNLAVSANANGITLVWDAPAGQVDGYVILRRRPRLGESSLQTLVADTGSSATTYTDTTATDSTRYTYRVKAIRNGVIGRRSNYARIDI